MRRIAIFAAIFWGVAVLEGCGGSETPVPESQAQAQPKAPPVPPEVVTREFLEAVRTGDHVKADSLLTDLAREKTKEVDLVLAPSASQTAKYEVGEQEIIDGQVAHVESFWTDIGDDGKPRTIPFVWALRLDTNGWRIGGVASKLFDDAPLLLLNFEDPADMLHKQEQLEAELHRRMNGGAVAGGAVAGGTTTNGTASPGSASPGSVSPMNASPYGVQAANGQPVGAQPNLGAPGALPPGAFPLGSETPVGALTPGNLSSPANMMPPTAFAPGAMSPGTANSNAAPPGTVVPAGGFSPQPGPGGVQPTGAQVSPAPGFLPPGSQAQQPLPPGTVPR